MNINHFNHEEVDFLIRLLEWHRDGLSCSYDLSLKAWSDEVMDDEYQQANSLLNKMSDWRSEQGVK
jgi:hypothetical protein